MAEVITIGVHGFAGYLEIGDGDANLIECGQGNLQHTWLQNDALDAFVASAVPDFGADALHAVSAAFVKKLHGHDLVVIRQIGAGIHA
ncbi:hypothetical protein DSECCO2_656650 [anaerobic digester metagenome]